MLLTVFLSRVLHCHADIGWLGQLAAQRNVSTGCETSPQRIEFHPTRPVFYLGDAVGGVLEIPLAGGTMKRFVSGDASTPMVERAHQGRVFWLEMGPEGRRIVSASGGRSYLPNSAGVHVWDVETRRIVLARKRSDPVLSVALSPDRKRVLLAVGGQGQVEVWPASDLFD